MKNPPRGGFLFLVKGRLALQFAANHSSQTDQSRSQQAQRTRLRNYDGRVSTRDGGGAIEVALAGVDRQLHGHTNRRCSLVGSRKGTDQRVIVSAVGKCIKRPGHGTIEGSGEQGAARNAVAAVTSDGERTAARERAAHLQGTADECSGCEADAAQVVPRDQPAPVTPIDSN